MAANKRFICIHGHFYQPPRENPWLETVETQDSAAPYHDWNERICAECYATNGAARIVNSKNQITRIVNNYARISFNFGPTLLSWLKENAPRTYRMILDGERRSRKSLSTATARRWRRSTTTSLCRWPAGATASRRSAGALPTISTTTARRPRACGWPRPRPTANRWSCWPSTASSSRCWRRTSASAFGRLKDGARLDGYAQRQRGHHPALPGPLRLRRLDRRLFLQRPGLAGHRLRGAAELRRELRRAAQVRLQRQLAAATGARGDRWRILRPPPQVRRNGAGLRAAPAGRGPDRQADQLRQLSGAVSARVRGEIVENTSWSCVHGVERWRSNCGCNGGKPGWNQVWRAPLRQALDELRDALVPLTEAGGRQALQRCVGGARRLHRGGARPQPGDRWSDSSASTRCARLPSRSACARWS